MKKCVSESYKLSKYTLPSPQTQTSLRKTSFHLLEKRDDDKGEMGRSEHRWDQIWTYLVGRSFGMCPYCKGALLKGLGKGEANNQIHSIFKISQTSVCKSGGLMTS